jgi:hypothetical protein
VNRVAALTRRFGDLDIAEEAAAEARSARLSSGVISRGQLLSSHPGVAWMCFSDEVQAS